MGSLTVCTGNTSWRKSVHELNIVQLTSACSRTLPRRAFFQAVAVSSFGGFVKRGHRAAAVRMLA